MRYLNQTIYYEQANVFFFKVSSKTHLFLNVSITTPEEGKTKMRSHTHTCGKSWPRWT